MKTKQFVIPIILLLIGLAVISIGALFKILHWEWDFITGDFLLVVGTLIKVLALTLVIIRLIFVYRNND